MSQLDEITNLQEWVVTTAESLARAGGHLNGQAHAYKDSAEEYYNVRLDLAEKIPPEAFRHFSRYLRGCAAEHGWSIVGLKADSHKVTFQVLTDALKSRRASRRKTQQTLAHPIDDHTPVPAATTSVTPLCTSPVDAAAEPQSDS